MINLEDSVKKFIKRKLEIEEILSTPNLDPKEFANLSKELSDVTQVTELSSSINSKEIWSSIFNSSQSLIKNNGKSLAMILLKVFSIHIGIVFEYKHSHNLWVSKPFPSGQIQNLQDDYDMSKDDRLEFNELQIELEDQTVGIWEADDEDDLIEEITTASGWCIKSIDYEIQLKWAL